MPSYPALKPKHEKEEGWFAEGVNSELLMHLFGNMNLYRDKHLDYDKDYYKCPHPLLNRSKRPILHLFSSSQTFTAYCYFELKK